VDDIIVRKRKVTNVSSPILVSKPKVNLMQSVMQPALSSATTLNMTPSLPALGKIAITDRSRTHSKNRSHGSSVTRQAKNLFNDYTIASFALIILVMALIGSPVLQSYMSSNLNLDSFNQAQPSGSNMGLNTSINAGQLQSEVQTITSQNANLDLGSSTVPIGASTIKSWLEITPNTSNTEDDIHTDPTVIAASLTSIVNSYIKAPVNQVTVTRADGSSEVAVAGQNGTKLVDPSTISAQAVTVAKNLFSGKGFQVNAPLTTSPFQALTAANFSKLLVADVNSKRLYVYQGGQLINTFLVSAGKPSTPTPIGEFHIWAKLTSQTMTGPGYVQPNVPWVNYFDHSGDAIHGVYWRPASVFGNVNTSHGCVGVPVNTGEWIYNWAPIGTTVITTPN
jgi:hypothetical protein